MFESPALHQFVLAYQTSYFEYKIKYFGFPSFYLHIQNEMLCLWHFQRNKKSHGNSIMGATKGIYKISTALAFPWYYNGNNSTTWAWRTAWAGEAIYLFEDMTRTYPLRVCCLNLRTLIILELVFLLILVVVCAPLEVIAFLSFKIYLS